MNKLFAILIMCSLSLPVIATEGQEAESVPEQTGNLEVLTTEEIDELNRTTPQDASLMTTTPESLPSRFKEPISKKKLAKKFIIAMLCVAGTSVFLYGTLSVYNKIRDGFTEQSSIPPAEGEQPLETPSDITDAVKTFIEKTHWDS